MANKHDLLISFLKIGLFGFGGGYAMLPLISHEVVDLHGWAGRGEFADMVAISQVTPGPIIINAATYLGYSVGGGVVGSALLTLAVCLPPFVIMLVVCRFFTKFKGNSRVAGAMRLLRPAIPGLVAAAALSLMTRANFTDWKSAIIFLAALAAATATRINLVFVFAAAGAAGWLLY